MDWLYLGRVCQIYISVSSKMILVGGFYHNNRKLTNIFHFCYPVTPPPSMHLYKRGMHTLVENQVVILGMLGYIRHSLQIQALHISYLVEVSLCRNCEEFKFCYSPFNDVERRLGNTHEEFHSCMDLIRVH